MFYITNCLSVYRMCVETFLSPVLYIAVNGEFIRFDFMT